MIFLKRIEAFGFKSFAEPTVLNFEYAMTGIVGPNGSGKSNINDAIMWALGEQSSKSLRGDSMEDIVFSGSSDRKWLNMAEVTLVFDNTKRAFSSLEYNEVAITRKYFKISKESEYYINGAKVRLKDVQDVALETGLTKSSLAIISQGSISSFVESSPEQRRKLFDEAAGVARYKKRKDEALRKLIRSQENLDRINDIINEIERKLPALKRQSLKANEYNQKFSELKSVEVAILVKDIQLYKKKIAEIKETKADIKTKINSLNRNIQARTDEFNQISKSSYQHDKELAKLNVEYRNVVDELAKLKISKINLEGKKSKADIDDKEFRVTELKARWKEAEIKLTAEEKKLSKALADKAAKKTKLDEFSKERFEFNNQLDVLRKELAKLESNHEALVSKKDSYDGLFEGVRNVLENRNVLSGIVGTVQELVNVEDKHKIAISTALQNAFQNIVAKSAADVKRAIDFLKTNRAGSATFLPLDTIKPNFISNEMRFAVQKSAGFIGFGNEIAKIDKKYQIVLDFLLATNIIADTFENALEIAKLTNYRFHIITLEGERIAPFGAITGGSRKNKNNLFTDANKLSELEAKIKKLSDREAEIASSVNTISEQIELFREEGSEIQSTIGASKQAMGLIEAEMAELNEEFRVLTGKELDNEEQSFKSIDEQIIGTIQSISNADTKRQEIDKQMNVLRSLKDNASEKLAKLSLASDEERRLQQALNQEYAKLNTDDALLHEKQMSANERLVQNYNLTFEAAVQDNQTNVENETQTRERINVLRSEIKALGNINFDSIADYEEENDRYQTYVTQSNDVISSIKNLKDAINNMDTEMTVQFKKIIKDVNEALPNTFATLFSGGTASLVYTNPDDILNSGIDIKISPPGKKITNLNLLSGGEKSMVALSVLFSILKVKPIPLVILDEVEAPLDIANVERFAKYLKSFTNETQFMIVTHRMGTMENCDILFGATMQQKGVTKLVQVKLVEAKKMTNAN